MLIKTVNLSLIGRKHCKWKKCWLPAFSPFPTMFSRDFYPKGRQKSHGVIVWKRINLVGNIVYFPVDNFNSARMCRALSRDRMANPRQICSIPKLLPVNPIVPSRLLIAFNLKNRMLKSKTFFGQCKSRSDCTERAV